jgi:CRP-like cAMP-binding protein
MDIYMKKYIEVLENTSLFKGIAKDEILTMLDCLCTVNKKYQKNSTIINMEDKISSVGVVLSGNIQIIKEDHMGNSSILTNLKESDIFLETFVCANIGKSPVRVMAITDSEILFIDYNKIINTCSSACIFHTILIENMLREIAFKNISLNTKMEIISKRSIREKITAYLEYEGRMSKDAFKIPFTRNELADYLCVDRSALSRELCKMRDEGLIDFNKNRFQWK